MKFLAALSTGLLVAAYSLPALASDAEFKLDLNDDGVADDLDLEIVRNGFGYSWMGSFDDSLDFDRDGEVDQVDVNIWSDEFATYSTPEPVYTPPVETPASDSTASGESSTSGSDSPVDTPVVDTPVVDTPVVDTPVVDAGDSSGDSTGSNAEAQGPDISAFDINGDGILDSSDADYYLTNLMAKPGQKNYVAIADIDGSGKITVVDKVSYAKDLEDAGLDFSGESRNDEPAEDETEPDVIEPEPPVEDVAQEEETNNSDPTPPVDDVEVVEEEEPATSDPAWDGEFDPSFRVSGVDANDEGTIAATVGLRGKTWLQIFDTSNETVTPLSALSDPGLIGASGVLIAGDKLYAVVFDPDLQAEFCSVDIEDASAPRLIDCIAVGSERAIGGSVSVLDGLAYVFTEGQLDVVDVNARGDLIPVRSISTRGKGSATDSMMAGGRLFGVYEKMLIAFDLANRRNPVDIHAFGLNEGRSIVWSPGSPSVVVLDGANYRVYDISSSKPSHLRSDQTAAYAVDIAMDNGDLYAAQSVRYSSGATAGGVSWISDDHRSSLESIQTEGIPVQIVIKSGMVFVASNGAGLEVIPPAD